MKTFKIFYYDLEVRTVLALNKSAAVRLAGIYYGGMVGITVREG